MFSWFQLRELQDRYDQLFEMLEEAQDELKMLRRKQKPGAVKRHYMSSSAYLPTDSLASELENSIHGDSDYPEGFAPADKKWGDLYKIWFKISWKFEKLYRIYDLCNYK